MRFWAGDATEGMEELERAAGHARSAADRTLEAEIYGSWLVMARHGPVPSSELDALAVELRRRVPTSRRLEVRALSALAIVAALRDDPDTARRICAEANTLAGELRFASSASIDAEVESLAGNWPVAEQLLRADLERFEQIGDMGHYASLVLPFVDALVAQGRGEESGAVVELAARFAIHDDADAKIGVESSRATLRLLEGDLGSAEAHAREAVAKAERTQYTIHHIRALSGLADVLAADGRTDEAKEAFDRAIELAQQKESLAHERILRAKLAELAAQPPATA
jgi:tetratricopeptide (TPR) repeat protein